MSGLDLTSMISSYLKKLKNNLSGGKDTPEENAGLARQINGLTENSSLADVGVEVAFRICSGVPDMNRILQFSFSNCSHEVAGALS
jgi:hypothetical protein